MSNIIKFDLNGSHYWLDAPKKYEDLAKEHYYLFSFKIMIDRYEYK